MKLCIFFPFKFQAKFDAIFEYIYIYIYIYIYLQRINQDKANFIELYYLNQMSANYKQDEKQLKEILNKNVSPANTDSKIKLTIYYKI